MENRKASHLTILTPTAQTISGSGAQIEVGEYKEALVTLNITAVSGTSPTLLVQIQASDDNGTTWYNLPNAAFTSASTVSSQAIQINTFGDYIRAEFTIGGTTPSFTFGLKAVCKG